VLGTPDAEEALKIIFSPDPTEAGLQGAITYMVGDTRNAKMAGDILRSSHATGPKGRDCVFVSEGIKDLGN